MAELTKAERNRLRKPRTPGRARTRDEIAELLRLAHKSSPFNSMPAQPRRQTRPATRALSPNPRTQKKS